MVSTFGAGGRTWTVNGVQVASDAEITNTNDASDLTKLKKLNNAFTGRIFLVRMYNRRLSLGEIQQNYNFENGRFV